MVLPSMLYLKKQYSTGNPAMHLLLETEFFSNVRQDASESTAVPPLTLRNAADKAPMSSMRSASSSAKNFTSKGCAAAPGCPWMPLVTSLTSLWAQDAHKATGYLNM